ncbi:hypothetical protein Taro_001072 [Colocasia esculenta]|uniref:Uncharacterized protein n=1 Tax=Colocasia esculenta TaxID=4460 RepID=A0A843TF12_COLES|nr:hypothetical protein [Colocasia esculenta]
MHTIYHHVHACRHHEMIRPKLYKNLVRVVSTLDQVVSTPCSKHKTKSCKTGQVVSTLVQVVSTLDHLPEAFWVKLGECVDTRWGGVDTRGLPRTLSGLFWDRRSTLAQAVSTLVAHLEQNTWSGVTRKYVSCSDSLPLLITL